MQSSLTSDEADEIARAEQRVAQHKAELSRSLRRVGQSGEHFAQRLTHDLKPAVVVAVAVLGTAAAVAVGVAFVRRARKRPHHWLAPEQPSRLQVAAKTAGVWALRLLARRIAQEAVSRLSDPEQLSQPRQRVPYTPPPGVPKAI